VPTALVPLGDSHFGVVDAGLRRFTVYDDKLRMRSLYPIPLDHSAEAVVRDADGRWVSVDLVGRAGDSVPLIMSQGDSQPPQLVAMMYSPRTVLIDRGESALNSPVEYQGADKWGVLTSGVIWIAHVGDNSVTWIRPDGAIEKGQGLPFDAIKTVRGDLRRWRGMPVPSSFMELERPMAKLKAAFQNVVAAENGELWYWMNQEDGYSSELYQCRTRSNQWGTSLRIPYGSRLVSVGANAAYFYEQSADGDVQLAAYTLPSCEKV
jgi:hypothetical protein